MKRSIIFLALACGLGAQRIPFAGGNTHISRLPARPTAVADRSAAKPSLLKNGWRQGQSAAMGSESGGDRENTGTPWGGVESPAQAQWWKRHLGDTAIHLGATTADIISSRGLIEQNPLLRDSRGQIGARGISIKLGAFVAIESAKWALLRRGHRGAWVRALSLVPAGVYAGAAAHNWRIR